MTLVLAFDTSAAHCAAALLRDDEVIATHSEAMRRGQAERLFPILETVLNKGQTTWQALTTIAVGVGPGNFTGIRIAVSAARGLQLSLAIPALGITTFDAAIASTGEDCLAVVPAPRDQVYARAPGKPPVLIPASAADSFALPVVPPLPPEQTVVAMARLAALGHGATPPTPLYIRAADAAPSSDPPPVILPDDA